MTNQSCDSFADLLIEYADGELSASDTRRVADHLAACPACGAELRLMRHSLDLARSIWLEAADDAPVPSTCCTEPLGRRVRVAACLAASVAMLATAAVVWLSLHGGPHRGFEQTDRKGHTTAVRLPKEVDEEVDIEAFIAREGRSARLAAAAELLATQPGLELYKEQADRYLAEAYRGTAAADRIARPAVPRPTKEPES